MTPPATKYVERTIPRISLRDFASRIPAITSELVRAAETDGFFVLVDHGIPWSDVESQFARCEAFFALPDATKARVPFSHRNVGWERNAQVRPSTGAADTKESYQMQFGAAMDGMWLPDSVLPGFEVETKRFMHTLQALSEQIMLCFARGLGLPDSYFVSAHDSAHPGAQTVLRALHYPALDPDAPVPEGGLHRAGAHADWDFLTLLFQRPGQSGLEICPGREVFTEFGAGDTWTKVDPKEGEIVCNM